MGRDEKGLVHGSHRYRVQLLAMAIAITQDRNGLTDLLLSALRMDGMDCNTKKQLGKLGGTQS